MKARNRRKSRGSEMEWDEALLEAWGGEITPQSSAYHRRKAACARQIAEAVATRTVKARRLDEAVHCDQLADYVDHVAGEAGGL